jgi:hypothetical protein
MKIILTHDATKTKTTTKTGIYSSNARRRFSWGI